MEPQPNGFDNFGGLGTAPSFGGLGAAQAPENFDLANDESQPIAYNPLEISREATRWLFFPGDIITASQKRERKDLRSGGEYLGQEYKTLSYYSKGLVRKCQLTPMVKAFDFVGEQSMGANETQLTVSTIVEQPAANGAPKNKLFAVPVYPGDEIKGLMQAVRSNNSKGIIELEQLAGREVAEVKEMGLQLFIFENWKEIVNGVASLPVKLSDLEKHFYVRRKATSESTIHGILDAMLSACDQYRNWGREYLKTATGLVKMPAFASGYAHTYSELAESLFEQLEIPRQDLINSGSSTEEVLARFAAGSEVSASETQSLIAQMAKNQELLTQLLMRGEAPPIERVPVAEIDFTVGQEVTVADGRTGKVAAKPFGRLKIAFDDDSTEMFDKDQVNNVHV